LSRLLVDFGVCSLACTPPHVPMPGVLLPLVLLPLASAASADAAVQRRSRGRDLAKVSLAGAASCSLTHTMVVPLDVIKTRLQTQPELAGPRAACRAILAGAERPLRVRAFLHGSRATAAGYWLQGAFKFGGYELCKRAAFGTLRRDEEQGERRARAWRLPVMIGSAATAEVIATFFLCPLETAKLRMQTDAASRAAGLLGTLRHAVASEGVGSLLKGYVPIALRQVPYSSSKLVCFELCASALLGLLARLTTDDDAIVRLRPALVLAAGMGAGICAAIVSQPADVLLTRMYGVPQVTSTAISECVIVDGPIAQMRYLYSLGVRQAFAGLGPRLVMISSMTSVQFLVYDSLRRALGCEPQGH